MENSVLLIASPILPFLVLAISRLFLGGKPPAELYLVKELAFFALPLKGREKKPLYGKKHKNESVLKMEYL
jgi:hypothetical protein